MTQKNEVVSHSESDPRELQSAVVKLLEASVDRATRTRKEIATIATPGRGKTAILLLYLQAYTEQRTSSFGGGLANLLDKQQEWSTSLDEELRHQLLKRIRNVLAHGRTKEARSTVQLVREGYRTRVGQVFSEILEMQSTDLLARLGIPRRTAERRLTQERFTAEESDRLYRAMDITRYAIEVFGDADTAAKWMKEPNPALDGVTPLSLLDTGPGTNKIRELLTRIDHGVYS